MKIRGWHKSMHTYRGGLLKLSEFAEHTSMSHLPQCRERRCQSVRSVFIYHMLYGSLLVCCRHVVNKDCRLLPSAPVAVPVGSIHCTLLFAFIAPCCSHSSHPVARIHRALLFAFIAPTFKTEIHGHFLLKLSMDWIVFRSSLSTWQL